MWISSFFLGMHFRRSGNNFGMKEDVLEMPWRHQIAWRFERVNFLSESSS